MTKLIVPLFNTEELSKKIAEKTGYKLADVEVRKFPDREIYFRIDSDVKGADMFLVQSGYTGPNHALVEVLLAADTCKDLGAKSITVVFPYLSYSRQDQRFRDGEAFSLQTISHLLRSVGVTKLVTVDAHNWSEYGELDLFGLKNLNITAGKLLVENIMKKYKLDKVHVISPDLGASILVKEAAKVEGAESSFLKKVRKGDFDVEMSGDLDVEGKNVIILDDIVSTGGTMLLAIQKAREAGCKKVFLACVHGIFGWDSLEKLRRKSDGLVATDAVENKAIGVSLGGEIAKVI